MTGLTGGFLTDTETVLLEMVRLRMEVYGNAEEALASVRAGAQRVRDDKAVRLLDSWREQARRLSP